MRKINTLLICIGIALFSCQDKIQKSPETELEKVSYSLGINIATSVKSQGMETIDVNSVAKAISDVFEENDFDISEEEGLQLLQEYFKNISEIKQEKAKEEEEKYLSENASREGVITTESGLQYEIINSGNGPKPSADDQVTVHYHGKLINDTVFDSSVERGEPATFPVNGVIPGWVEALQLMSVGDKWKLTIPSNLAYGERGAGGVIGPGATLIFEVELLKIN